MSRISQGILVPRRRLDVERFFQNEKAERRGIELRGSFSQQIQKILGFLIALSGVIQQEYFGVF